MIVPSAASRAAPTLNPENRAWALRRAFRAAAINALVESNGPGTGGPTSREGSSPGRLPPSPSRRRTRREGRPAVRDRGDRSDTLDDPFEQRDERPADTTGGFHHLIVDERLRQHPGGHVGDAGNTQH